MVAIFLNCWRQTLLLFLNILSSKDKVCFLRKILEGGKIHASLPLETLELVFYLAQPVKSGWHLGSKSAFLLEISWKKQFKNHSAFKLWPSQMADLNNASLIYTCKELRSLYTVQYQIINSHTRWGISNTRRQYRIYYRIMVWISAVKSPRFKFLHL